MGLGIVSNTLIILSISPLAMAAYSSRLQEVVLLNLGTGDAQYMLLFSYVVCMVINSSIMISPMIDTVKNLIARAFKPKKEELRFSEA